MNLILGPHFVTSETADVGSPEQDVTVLSIIVKDENSWIVEKVMSLTCSWKKQLWYTIWLSYFEEIYSDQILTFCDQLKDISLKEEAIEIWINHAAPIIMLGNTPRLPIPQLKKRIFIQISNIWGRSIDAIFGSLSWLSKINFAQADTGTGKSDYEDGPKNKNISRISQNFFFNQTPPPPQMAAETKNFFSWSLPVGFLLWP